jgi:hypothetical protein
MHILFYLFISLHLLHRGTCCIEVPRRHVIDHDIHNAHAHSIQHKQMVLQQPNDTALSADAMSFLTL